MGRKRRPSAMPATRAIGYIRVSKEEQDLSPEAQRTALEKWCASHKLELVTVFTENVSGGAPLDKRPQLLAAVDALSEQQAGVLLVLRRDRLARDNVAAAMIDRLAERKGARVLSTDGVGNGEGPEAQLMRGIIDLFAQYERALIRARTKAALAVKRARGQRLGGELPLGHLAPDGVHLAPHPEERKVVSWIHQRRNQGWTLQAITDALNAGCVPARGKQWHLTTIARVLQRAA